MTSASRGARFPSREEAVLRYLLEARAKEDPTKTFAVFDGGPEWTRSDVLRLVRQTAGALEDLGVRRGDNVVCWLPNGPDALRYWFAINYIGAVMVPINTAYRGGLLSHVLENSDARLLIGDGALLPRLAELSSRGRLSTVVQVGGRPVRIDGIVTVDSATLENIDVDPSELDSPLEPWDLQAILYTSGTTGPSKGVMSSYMQAYAAFGPETMPMVGSEDRYLINMPIFHLGGSSLLYGMLLNGGSVAVVERFSGERFWSQIRELDATVVFLLGVMANFIERRPSHADDPRNPLTKVFMAPLLDDVDAFSERFGVDVYTIYNMTELSAPLISDPNPTLRGTCGRARPGVDVRLVDAYDREVPEGEVGEIVVRTDSPWALNSGYYKMPEATAAAWRNGWFHTGDAARVDEGGNYFFVDRMKDAIRRRGENISSMEVENEFLAHPHVREAAAVAVPSDISEDEVLVIVSAVPGAVVDPEELIRFVEPRMPYYMVPRYLRIVTELPKTPTSKILKSTLRDQGLTADVWDREAAGIVVSR